MIFLTDHISLEHQVNTMKKWHICSRFDKTVEIFREEGKKRKLTLHSQLFYHLYY